MDINTERFITHSTNIVNELDKFRNTLFRSFPAYSDSVNDLKNSLDYIKVQYDPSTSMQSNQEAIAKFADRYFKAIVKLFTLIKSINNNNDTTLIEDLNNQFHDIAIDIVSLIGEYGDLLKYYAEDIRNTVGNATSQFKKTSQEVKTNPQVFNSVPENDMSYTGLFGEANLNEWSFFNSSEDVSRSAQYSKALETYNSLPADKRQEYLSTIESPSIRTALQINRVTDGVGGAINTGMDSLGDMFGYMFVKIGDGTEHMAYCIDIINKQGFDAFLNDQQSMQYVRDGVIYGTIFLGIIMIVRSILRRVTGFLAWISGYRSKR